MADEQRSVALVILGVVAVMAVVGLVLMLKTDGATGNGIYGGALKGVDYPYWVNRGTPRDIPGSNLWPAPESKTPPANWNFYGSPDRNPVSDVSSALKGCGNGGLLVPRVQGGVDSSVYYNQKGYTVVDPGDSKAGLCVYPNQPLVGGVVGQN